jgi:hypothetical protein
MQRLPDQGFLDEADLLDGRQGSVESGTQCGRRLFDLPMNATRFPEIDLGLKPSNISHSAMA